MAAHPLLAKIRADAEIEALLAWPFDFDVAGEPDGSWFRLNNGLSHVTVAHDAAGGAYALCGGDAPGQAPVLYVTSEGQAGIVGSTLHEFLGILLAAPFWSGLLKFSGGGLLEAMRAAVPFLEREALGGGPQPEQSALIRARLGIASPADPVALLHSSVSLLSPQFPVVSSDGDPFESLFNTFVATDNPMWSRA